MSLIRVQPGEHRSQQLKGHISFGKQIWAIQSAMTAPRFVVCWSG